MDEKCPHIHKRHKILFFHPYHMDESYGALKQFKDCEIKTLYLTKIPLN